MSTRLRQEWLKILRLVGIRHIVSRSGLGHSFVCHLGDFFGENPFYERDACRRELELCAAWLHTERAPVVLDVGANLGFWSTQLAQMLDHATPSIYAIEPAPQTFCKLVRSVEVLKLDHCVFPIAAAVGNGVRIVYLSVNPSESGLAQVTKGALNPRAGDRLTHSVGLSLDELVDTLKIAPSLVKIDVEGSEIEVLKGARRLFTRPDRPALLFELNPLTLAEVGESTAVYADLLPGYSLYYVDDFQGQKREYGSHVARLMEIDWVCNIFAVPATDLCSIRFSSALALAGRRIEARRDRSDVI